MDSRDLEVAISNERHYNLDHDKDEGVPAIKYDKSTAGLFILLIEDVQWDPHYNRLMLICGLGDPPETSTKAPPNV